jgi:hypothetical protein
LYRDIFIIFSGNNFLQFLVGDGNKIEC